MSLERVIISPPAVESAARAAVVARARSRGFRRFVAAESGASDARSGEEWFLQQPDSFRRLLPPPANSSSRVSIRRVRGPEDLDPVLSELRQGRPVAVRWTAERVIPLETLVAARSTPGTLWVVTDRPEEVPGFLGALEHGADAVVVSLPDEASVDSLEGLVDRAGIRLAWELVPVTRVVPAGIGDRVIVDTTSLLKPEEGLLVGSAAAFLLHVASEAVGSRYTRPRPFRVNAGAAHSYTLLSNGETRYLTELEPGDAVLVGAPGGSTRSVRVGRIKLERRPLVLVEVERGKRRFTVFLQEAETVRLSAEGRRIPTTELQPTNRVHGVSLPPARHLGVRVAETIEER